MARRVVTTVIATVVLLAPGRAAFADGGEEDFTARDLVEQAIGLLQGQPDMTDLIEDRIADALEDDEVEGVDLTLVAMAGDAFEAGDATGALDLLAGSIGEQVGPALHQPEVGGGVQAPDGSAGLILLLLAAILVVAGGVVAAKVR